MTTHTKDIHLQDAMPTTKIVLYTIETFAFDLHVRFKSNCCHVFESYKCD